MSAIKNYMHDVHDDAYTLGIFKTAKKHSITTDEVKRMVMLWQGFPEHTTWSDFEDEMNAQPNGMDDVSGEDFIPPE